MTNDLTYRLIGAERGNARALHRLGIGPARPAPAWCRSPFLRGWVMGQAIAAPLLLLAVVLLLVTG